MGKKQETKMLLEQMQRQGIHLQKLQLNRWSRFQLDPSDHKKSGSYFATRTSLGHEVTIYSHRSGETHQVRNFEDSKLTEEEKALHDLEIAMAKKVFERRALIGQETVALEATHRWSRSKPDPSHPKLQQRGLHFTYGSRVEGDALLIPCKDMDGKLWDIQVHHFGKKPMFSHRSRQKGCFHLIGEISPSEPLFICEGFITSATVAQLAGFPVVCAFSANNLSDVAIQFREKYPELQIIISGDSDETGRKNSEKAARLAKARFLIPDFGFQHPDFTDWNDMFLKLEGGGAKMAIEQLIHFKEISHAGEFDQFFKEWIQKNNIKVEMDTNVSMNGKSITFDQLNSRLQRSAFHTNRSLRLSLCQGALEDWITEESKRLRAEIIQKITKYEPSDQMMSFVAAIARKEDDFFLIFAVMNHLLWQVKRKMLQLPVYDHLMVVLSGPQGSGKSEAVKKLVEILSGLKVEKNVYELTDERAIPMFESNYMISLDEMGKAEKADIEILKNRITSDVLNYRPMRTNMTKPIRNNASFIGTSNSPVSTLFYDTSGMRRFFDIVCKPKCDWEAINSIDYLALWQSIDPYQKSYIDEVRDKLQSAQKEMTYISEVGEFLEEMGAEPSDLSFIDFKTLYEAWKRYEEETGSKPMSQKALSTSIVRMGYERLRKGRKKGVKMSSSKLVSEEILGAQDP